MTNEVKKSPWPSRFELGFDILKLIAAGTIVLASLATPNLAQVLPVLNFDPNDRRRRPYHPSDISRAVKILKKGSFIHRVRTRNGYAIHLTERGEAALARFEIGNLKLKNPEKWDGKWRLIIFDIREWHKHVRNRVRELLVQNNFLWLQDSVWIYPFPCEEFAELIKTGYGVRHELLYLVVSSMAYDERLRNHFSFIFGRSFARTTESSES